MNILEVVDIHKSFGGFEVLKGISFEAEEGKITGLIGPNGSGKSTLFNIMSGVMDADSGDIRYKGKSIINLSPEKINLQGISRTYQDTRLFSTLTVLENLMLPPKYQAGEKLLSLFSSKIKGLAFKKEDPIKLHEEELQDKALEILRLLEIEHMGYEYANKLSATATTARVCWPRAVRSTAIFFRRYGAPTASTTGQACTAY